jgi:DNA-binding MarR family transcriptional regulator
LAAEAWRAILDFITLTAGQRTRILAELGLTVSDSRALTTLDAEHGRTMRSLADEWSCDASTATWIVDRLEQRGLAERRSDATDRRLRLAALTAAGVTMRDEMLRRMYAAPPELLALEETDLAVLRDGVTRLPTAPAATDRPSAAGPSAHGSRRVVAP